MLLTSFMNKDVPTGCAVYFVVSNFIKNKSTVTAGLVLQSLIARAMDDDCYVALAGIDLSAAFDIVDMNC